jgi:SAM-dependent methyltransferase
VAAIVGDFLRRIIVAPDVYHRFCWIISEAPRLHWSGVMKGLHTFIKRRFQRMRRRRKVGRAYDMALEVARTLPPRAGVLDVGCGNGFIAHHLTGLLGTTVVGLDVGKSTSASINYLPYDGRHFPLKDQSFDAVLLCYVLHHAQDAVLVLNEVSRVLREGGVAIIYEDIPSLWWDRLVCWTHDRQWRDRTGPCTFRVEQGWRKTFSLAGFEIVSERPLSRWRNLAHPVARRFYVIRTNQPARDLTQTDNPALQQVSDHAQAVRFPKWTDGEYGLDVP